MKRWDVREIEDQAWCPAWLRSAMTGYLQEAIRLSRPYAGAASPIAELLNETGETRVVDLGSGAGGPWPELRDAIAAEGGGDVHVVLTDLHPDAASVARAQGRGTVRYHRDPVSAFGVPRELAGIRTMFTALHHFSPSEVGAILEAAQRDRAPFAAFEATHRSVRGILVTLLVPLLVLVLMPRVRPLRWRALAFTYLIPIVPLAIWWDGLASTLRTYRAREVEEVVRRIADDTFEWRVTERDVDGLPIPMLQVIGRPI